MNDKKNRILVVDDELGMREGCRKVLTSEGYEVETAEDGVAALKLFKEEKKFAVALIDLKMPGMGGMELIEEIQKHDKDIVLLVITAYATIGTAVEATKKGAYGYIPKPFTPDELLLPVKNGLEKRDLSLRARKLETAKASFISMVSHEISSHLGAIEGYLNLILTDDEKNVSKKNRTMMERMSIRAKALRTMISDLTNLSAIENGRFSIVRTPLEIEDVVREVIQICIEKAEKKRIELSDNCEDFNKKLKVSADRDALITILRNLVDNAVKYTPDGGHVKVTIEYKEKYVTVVISDDGIGMTQEEKGKVFEEY